MAYFSIYRLLTLCPLIQFSSPSYPGEAFILRWALCYHWKLICLKHLPGAQFLQFLHLQASRGSIVLWENSVSRDYMNKNHGHADRHFLGIAWPIVSPFTLHFKVLSIEFYIQCHLAYLVGVIYYFLFLVVYFHFLFLPNLIRLCVSLISFSCIFR